jgi:hypothetical protein
LTRPVAHAKERTRIRGAESITLTVNLNVSEEKDPQITQISQIKEKNKF